MKKAIEEQPEIIPKSTKKFEDTVKLRINEYQ